MQGAEAGGHRGSFADRAGRCRLRAAVAAAADRRRTTPLVATGGIATGAGVAAVLAAGARAAQVGTAFLRCPEAGTPAAHRAALADATPTALTRAFTGRLARGIANRFMDEHPEAPIAYPEIHHATAPLRAEPRAGGRCRPINLWAGEAHALARERPAAEVVAELARDARAALARARL